MHSQSRAAVHRPSLAVAASFQRDKCLPAEDLFCNIGMRCTGLSKGNMPDRIGIA